MDERAEYEALLSATRDIVAVLDDTGTIEYVNPAVERIVGHGPAAFVGDNAFEHIPEADRQSVADTFGEIAEAPVGTELSVEHRYRTPEGETIWLESWMSNRHREELSGYVVTARDVTDRKRAERERRETEAQLQRIADNTSDVLWMFAADFSELLFVNDAYEEIWGRPTAILADEPLDFLEGTHPKDRQTVREATEQLADGESVDVEFRVNASEGYGRWVRLQGSPVVEDGAVVCLVAVAHDVTKRRERERQVRAMDSVLRHNLRNEMNIITGHAGRLGDVADFDREAADHLRRIIEHGESVLETADKGRHIVELLGPGDERNQLDIASVVRETASAAAAAHPDAELRISAPKTAMAGCVTKTPLLVTELIDNALTHTGQAATIALTVRETDQHIELVVADDGPPIPKADRRAIVGDTDITQLQHGSGLGLWLVAWIVRCSGGSIVFAADDTGNEVTVRFRRAT